MSFYFEIHKDLPREGPGDNASTRKALEMMTSLPERPALLDVGCGPGVQTSRAGPRHWRYSHRRGYPPALPRPLAGAGGSRRPGRADHDDEQVHESP